MAFHLWAYNGLSPPLNYFFGRKPSSENHQKFWYGGKNTHGSVIGGEVLLNFARRTRTPLILPSGWTNSLNFRFRRIFRTLASNVHTFSSFASSLLAISVWYSCCWCTNLDNRVLDNRACYVVPQFQIYSRRITFRKKKNAGFLVEAGLLRRYMIFLRDTRNMYNGGKIEVLETPTTILICELKATWGCSFLEKLHDLQGVDRQKDPHAFRVVRSQWFVASQNLVPGAYIQWMPRKYELPQHFNLVGGQFFGS